MPKVVAQKEDWIELGYQLFTQSGERGIVVEAMSKVLKCNKSSFYWHFKTKKDFMNCLVKFWIDRDTQRIMEQVKKAATAQEQLDCLLEITFKKDPNLDFVFYLKRYAQSNSTLQHLIDQIDADRIQFTATLFHNLGSPKKEAHRKAVCFYKYLIGYHEMIRYKEQGKDYIEEVKQELDLLLKF
ncbi:TetR/AcrR family transcriptional regulator [Aureispira anguillae]|uniref:TetR/AcrR family transcriptional regulator n=1 Tax=Aureispira anguillae TaxID=2864201 RepID=A0A915YGN5_9BACT|nr:TetR/AcrR family transcriptional regulator [Aureispira anguillae]BDS12679.1 TetR/AcrR family transcriptional regulator [Aureispira anguillae]